MCSDVVRKWGRGEALLGLAIAAQGPALNNPGQHHMQMFTTADIPSTTVDDEPCRENHQKNKKSKKTKNKKKGGAPLDGTWGSITKMVRLGAATTFLVV